MEPLHQTTDDIDARFHALFNFILHQTVWHDLITTLPESGKKLPTCSSGVMKPKVLPPSGAQKCNVVWRETLRSKHAPVYGETKIRINAYHQSLESPFFLVVMVFHPSTVRNPKRKVPVAFAAVFQHTHFHNLNATTPAIMMRMPKPRCQWCWWLEHGIPQAPGPFPLAGIEKADQVVEKVMYTHEGKTGVQRMRMYNSWAFGRFPVFDQLARYDAVWNQAHQVQTAPFSTEPKIPSISFFFKGDLANVSDEQNLVGPLRNVICPVVDFLPQTYPQLSFIEYPFEGKNIYQDDEIEEDVDDDAYADLERRRKRQKVHFNDPEETVSDLEEDDPEAQSSPEQHKTSSSYTRKEPSRMFNL
jgi:hypothetical protein